MGGVTLRAALRDDIGDICRVWEICFGDAPETVKSVLEPETLGNTTVAELDGRICSLMTAFDGLKFGGVKGSYILALCTEPGFRGRGFGERVLLETARRAFERGAELVCLHPASEGLARWYAGLGMEALSRVLSEPAPDCRAGTAALERVSYGEYAALRAGAFPSVPEALLRAQELFYTGGEGGFFKLTAGGERGCMCLQRTENAMEIRELLCRGRCNAAAAAAASELFGCHVSLPRVLPADSEKGSTHLMGMWKNGKRGVLPKPPYLPFILD